VINAFIHNTCQNAFKFWKCGSLAELYFWFSAVDKEISVLKVVLPVMASLLILACIFLVWICKSRGRTRFTLLFRI
jgi:hypothetical protein